MRHQGSYFLNNRLADGGEVVSLTSRQRFALQKDLEGLCTLEKKNQ
jgi:hypothetical protein